MPEEVDDARIVRDILNRTRVFLTELAADYGITLAELKDRVAEPSLINRLGGIAHYTTYVQLYMLNERVVDEMERALATGDKRTFRILYKQFSKNALTIIKPWAGKSDGESEAESVDAYLRKRAETKKLVSAKETD